MQSIVKKRAGSPRAGSLFLYLASARLLFGQVSVCSFLHSIEAAGRHSCTDTSCCFRIVDVHKTQLLVFTPHRLTLIHTSTDRPAFTCSSVTWVSKRAKRTSSRTHLINYSSRPDSPPKMAPRQSSLINNMAQLE